MACFSWELIDKEAYLVGDEARKAFNDIMKSNAIFHFPWDEDTKLETKRNEITADMIDAYEEVYVVTSDWSWTYIKTHEEGLGPYFYKR